MKLFKKPMTWGGWLGVCAAVLVALAGAVCYAFGFHKVVWDKCKEIKRKLW